VTAVTASITSKTLASKSLRAGWLITWAASGPSIMEQMDYLEFIARLDPSGVFPVPLADLASLFIEAETLKG